VRAVDRLALAGDHLLYGVADGNPPKRGKLAVSGRQVAPGDSVT